jgi:hypothetical protein
MLLSVYRALILGFIAFFISSDKPRSDALSASATRETLSVSNAAGLRMTMAEEYANPALWLSIPDEPSGQNAVLIVFPEHVTVREHGSDTAEHLYLWRSANAGTPPHWMPTANGLKYEMEFERGIHFVAQAMLEEDGVLLHYEFINQANSDYDSVQAITDPRMLAPMFHDVRLERTYVHGPNGFRLLASDMPERLTMPLNKWLPNRYRISYSWPVDQTRVEKQADGIVFFNASERTDEPVLATVSTDHHWVLATFSGNPGNLWTNPDLTCQHADPEIAVAHSHTGIIEEKLLLFAGTLDDMLTRVHRQRTSLK